MALVVVAALAGLFGAGPLSWSSETASDGSVEVSFQRFARRGGPAELSLAVPVSGGQDQAEVWVDARYLERLDVELPRFERAVEGTPVVIFADGQPLRHRMDRARIDDADIMEAARNKQGLESSTK